ncbi:hypothetical protein CF642_38665, partial [Burkholderia pseudomallei]
MRCVLAWPGSRTRSLTSGARPRGRAPDVSERVRLPGHARTQRTIAAEGARAVYERRLCGPIAAPLRDRGGAPTLDALRASPPACADPSGKDSRRDSVPLPPPN